MALPLPNLDDRTYADLVAEARALIPTYDPTWTDHNPSSPGMTLLELFAWLTEMLIYRVNRVPDQHFITFLKLLNGPQWQPGPVLADDIRTSVAALRQQERAVTVADYETLALAATPDVSRVHCVPRRNLAAATEAARVTPQPGHVSVILVPHSLAVFLFTGIYADSTTAARTGGDAAFALNSAPGHLLYLGAQATFDQLLWRFEAVGAKYTLRFEYFTGAEWLELTTAAHGLQDETVNWSRDGALHFTPPLDWAPTTINGVIRYWLRVATTTAPAPAATAGQILLPVPLQPTADLCERVQADLEPRRLLTTRHHIVGPFYAPISAEILLARRADVREADLRPRVVAALTSFLDPLVGGPEGRGWPFGRAIYLSELYALLEALPGVDYVPDIRLHSACPPATPHCVTAEPLWHDDGELIGLDLAAHHLPKAEIDPARIVIATAFVAAQVRVTVKPPAGLAAAVVRRTIKMAVKQFFHPRHGGPNGAVTRVITVNDLRALVRDRTGLPQTDIVVALQGDATHVQRDDLGRATGIRFAAGELADAQVQVDVDA